MSLESVVRVLGDGNAENERNLERDFLRTPDYESVASNSRSLVLGGRGAGKSAIFRMLSRAGADEMAAADSVWSVDLSFDDVTRLKVERVANNEGDDVPAISRQWELAILLQCFELIMERAPSSTKRRKLLRALDDEIVKYLDRGRTRSVSVGRLGAMVEAAVNLLGRLPFKFVVTAPFLPISIETKDTERPPELPDHDRDRAAMVESMYGVIKEGLPAGTNIRVLIDELDVAWKATTSQVATLCGLMSAVMRVRGTLINLGMDERIAIALFLRSDIYEILKQRGLDDASKYRGHELHLRWNPSTLRSVLDHRLRVVDPAAQLTMRDLFTDEKISGKMIDEYLLEWITPRPRDLLTIVAECINCARLRGSDRITKEDADSAMTFYSGWRLSVILEESRYVLPGIDDIVSSFKNGPHQYTPREMRGHLDQAKKDYGVAWTKPRLIELLLDSGFLGVQFDGRRANTFIWDVSPGHSLGPREGVGQTKDVWVIHPPSGGPWRSIRRRAGGARPASPGVKRLPGGD